MSGAQDAASSMTSGLIPPAKQSLPPEEEMTPEMQNEIDQMALNDENELPSGPTVNYGAPYANYGTSYTTTSSSNPVAVIR